MALQITRIKPNPTGKDRNRYGQTPAAQLAAEWVDFQNNGIASTDLGSVELWHRAYHHGQAPTRDKVTSFTGALPAGKTVRVHSGSGPDSVIRDEDRRGADYHVFTGRDYVWNNKEGDTPALYNPATKVTLDSASYDPDPPEGEVLVRSGGKLVSVKVPASYSLR
jgi:Lamin Tail Domain